MSFLWLILVYLKNIESSLDHCNDMIVIENEYSCNGCESGFYLIQSPTNENYLWMLRMWNSKLPNM